MLHNSGPFGPNDVPINMGAPVNMTQISNPMNLGNNLSNLAKMPPQAAQTAAPQYNMPDYSSFGHPPLNMGHSMNPFANYHHMNFQTNFGHPSAMLPHDTCLNSVQNGMLPMNLNIQSDHAPNLMNYHSYDHKRNDTSTSNYRDHYSRKMPINVPQIHTKAFQKQLGMETNYGQYSSVQENPFSNQDSLKPTEKTLLDSNRRKSIENTVKLIENILINNTTRDKLRSTDAEPSLLTNVIVNIPKIVKKNEKLETQTDQPDKTEALMHNASLNDDLKVNTEIDNTNVDEQNKSISDRYTKASIPNDMSIRDEPNIQGRILCEPIKRSLLNNGSEGEKIQNGTEFEMDSDKESPIKVKEDGDMLVKVKVEAVAWTDTENSPFLRDCNATERDGIESDSVIVEGDNNVIEATEAVKNGGNPNTYYECCHCSLLFKHPKRFLIHTKWHSFGLTNEKRRELAREKETRKTMKKEARIIERLNSKEVKDKALLEGDVHPCKDCDKVFKVKSSLKNHRQRYHPTRVRECKICKATVVGWLALREHVGAHAGGGGYPCAECPKRFKYAHSLAKHKDTHLEKTHGCEQCEKKFGSQALLKMHMKCHERTARGATFRCTYCGKGFFESYNLQVHERTHRNERPFLCDICNSSFGTNSSLKRHLKVSHSTSKPFSCPTCQRCFATANTRDRHTARAHGDPSVFPHACNLCPRRYRACKDLQKHMYKVHKDRNRDQETEQD